MLSELARLAGELDPMVVEVRPLDEAGEARALVENGHATGKLVLVPWTRGHAGEDRDARCPSLVHCVSCNVQSPWCAGEYR